MYRLIVRYLTNGDRQSWKIEMFVWRNYGTADAFLNH